MNTAQKRIMTEEAAYHKGRQAYVDDRGPDDCPYSGNLREAWEQGYDDMRDERHDEDGA